MSQSATEFLKLTDFSYPIFFESGDSDFPYYAGGTCFSVRFKGRFYIFTASHCLNGLEGDPCILGRDQQRVPIKQVVSISPDENRMDWTDISCFTTYQTSTPSVDSYKNYDIDDLSIKELILNLDQILFIRGFPILHSNVDPPKITRQEVAYYGRYRGPTSELNVHYFEIISPQIDDPDGLSGSPVILMDAKNGKEVNPKLVGMVIRGGKECQTLRFIGVGVIFRFLFKLQEDDRNSDYLNVTPMSSDNLIP